MRLTNPRGTELVASMTIKSDIHEANGAVISTLESAKNVMKRRTKSALVGIGGITGALDDGAYLKKIQIEMDG